MRGSERVREREREGESEQMRGERERREGSERVREGGRGRVCVHACMGVGVTRERGVVSKLHRKYKGTKEGKKRTTGTFLGRERGSIVGVREKENPTEVKEFSLQGIKQ